MIDLYNGDCLEISHCPWVADFLKHLFIKEVIVMKKESV